MAGSLAVATVALMLVAIGMEENTPMWLRFGYVACMFSAAIASFVSVSRRGDRPT